MLPSVLQHRRVSALTRQKGGESGTWVCLKGDEGREGEWRAGPGGSIAAPGSSPSPIWTQLSCQCLERRLQLGMAFAQPRVQLEWRRKALSAAAQSGTVTPSLHGLTQYRHCRHFFKIHQLHIKRTLFLEVYSHLALFVLTTWWAVSLWWHGTLSYPNMPYRLWINKATKPKLVMYKDLRQRDHVYKPMYNKTNVNSQMQQRMHRKEGPYRPQGQGGTSPPPAGADSFSQHL